MRVRSIGMRRVSQRETMSLLPRGLRAVATIRLLKMRESEPVRFAPKPVRWEKAAQ